MELRTHYLRNQENMVALAGLTQPKYLLKICLLPLRSNVPIVPTGWKWKTPYLYREHSLKKPQIDCEKSPKVASLIIKERGIIMRYQKVEQFACPLFLNVTGTPSIQSQSSNLDEKCSTSNKSF